MSDILLYKGGMPALAFPSCDGISEFTADYPTRVAGDYGLGYYTLGAPLNFDLHPNQRGQVEKYKVSVGDTMFLLLVPSNSWIDDVAVAVREIDLNSNGLTYSLVVKEYDVTTNSATSINIFTNSAFSAINPVVKSFQAKSPDGQNTSHGKYFVGNNKIVLIGLKLLSLPSNVSVRLIDSLAAIDVITHVRTYDCPQQL